MHTPQATGNTLKNTFFVFWGLYDETAWFSISHEPPVI